MSKEGKTNIRKKVNVNVFIDKLNILEGGKKSKIFSQNIYLYNDI